MPFKPKPTRKKIEATYKSLYIASEVVEKVEQVAKENDTSFNNVVVSMIEKCLDEE